VAELEILASTKIRAPDTLLFFDEIQACPRAIMALRYFYEELPELHVIAAGSLLEFAINEIPFPVGRIQSLDMQPRRIRCGLRQHFRHLRLHHFRPPLRLDRSEKNATGLMAVPG
jgi:predicted AAA+ superfamily ATPase